MDKARHETAPSGSARRRLRARPRKKASNATQQNPKTKPRSHPPRTHPIQPKSNAMLPKRAQAACQSAIWQRMREQTEFYSSGGAEEGMWGRATA